MVDLIYQEQRSNLGCNSATVPGTVEWLAVWPAAGLPGSLIFMGAELAGPC